MGIKHPPELIPFETLTGADIASHQQYYRVLDEKGRYLPFDEFRHRVPRQENVALAWTLTRYTRNAAMQSVAYTNESGRLAGFVVTPAISETCELVDKYATRPAMDDLIKRLRGAGAELSQLKLDEPITSSQLEGANTTTLVARNMLETGRNPHTEDEHMIAGNARLMTEIPELLQESLTPDLIRRLHATGMGGINDDKYHPGEFRITDDVVIADYDGNVVHQPPKSELLPERLEKICEWANSNTGYIHPLVRACILHFMLAHEHPFRDGNGRTSRALFYWWMLKNGYEAFRYVSISSLLHAAPVKYAHSYQYTETDGMDLTYFLDYQATIIKKAVERLLAHVDELVKRAAAIDRALFESGAFSRLTARQVTLLNVMMASQSKFFAAADVKDTLGISDNTARTDLRALVREGLAEESAENDQKTVFRIARKFRS